MTPSDWLTAVREGGAHPRCSRTLVLQLPNWFLSANRWSRGSSVHAVWKPPLHGGAGAGASRCAHACRLCCDATCTRALPEAPVQSSAVPLHLQLVTEIVTLHHMSSISFCGNERANIREQTNKQGCSTSGTRVVIHCWLLAALPVRVR